MRTRTFGVEVQHFKSAKCLHNIANFSGALPWSRYRPRPNTMNLFNLKSNASVPAFQTHTFCVMKLWILIFRQRLFRRDFFRQGPTNSEGLCSLQLFQLVDFIAIAMRRSVHCIINCLCSRPITAYRIQPVVIN